MTVGNLVAQVSKRRSGILSDARKLVAPVFRNKIFDQHLRIFAPRKDFVKRHLCAAPIPLWSGARPNDGMKTNDCRRDWLRAFREKEGGIAELAEKIGAEPNYLSSILGPSAKRNVGDELARRTEQAYKLPPVSLDLPSLGTQLLINESRGMSDAEILEVVAFMKFKKGSKN